jgi:hypothetical protein
VVKVKVKGKYKGKGKDKIVPLLLTKHHAMKAYWGMEVQRHSFFDLGTRWRWVVSFTTRSFYLRERPPPPNTHWIGGWVGPRAGLDAMVKSKIPSPCRDSTPPLSIPQSSAIPLSYPGSSQGVEECNMRLMFLETYLERAHEMQYCEALWRCVLWTASELYHFRLVTFLRTAPFDKTPANKLRLWGLTS